ncbi:MAG: hypothetical protein AAF351_03750 [Pseudomonadota bacterium]
MSKKTTVMTSLLALLFTSLSACAGKDTKDAAAVVDYRIHNDQFELTVVSQGCTKKEDFDFEVRRSGQAGDAAVLVIRNREDKCKRMPFAMTFQFGLSEVGLRESEKVRLLNPTTSLKPTSRS